MSGTQTIDQRGFPRPVDGDAIAGAVRDIGAGEFQGATDVALFRPTDWDGDGICFAVEFALGTNPLVPDSGGPATPMPFPSATV